MRKQIPIYSERELNKFASEQWDKTLAYLQKQYSLSQDDSEDVFQEAFITLYTNIQNGKLKELTSSLSTYFIGICNKKIKEKRRKDEKGIPIDDEISTSLIDDKIDDIINIANEDELLKERKEALIRQIVSELPSPCNKLLWGSYRDNFDLKTLAQMFNYSIGTVKVTKHRCCEKFRTRFSLLCKKLFKDGVK